MKLHQNQRGMSVLLIAIVLSLLGIYAAVGNSLVAERSETIGGMQQSEQALYIAESGLKIALTTLENNWGTWDDANAFPEQTFADGSFDATVGEEGFSLDGYSYYPLNAAPNYGSNDDGTSGTTGTGDFSSQIGSGDQIYKLYRSDLAGDQAATSISGLLMKASFAKDNKKGDDDESDHLAGSYVDPHNSNKVLICHYPPGNVNNEHTISISKNALSTHQDHHGDIDGPCPGNDPNKIDVIVRGERGGSQRFIKASISKYVAALHNAIYSTGMVYRQGDNSTYVYGDTVQYATTFPTLDVNEARELARGNNDNGMLTRSDGNYFQGSIPADLSSLNGVIFVDEAADGTPASVSLSNLNTLSSEPALLMVRGSVWLNTVNFNGLVVVIDGSLINLAHANINGAILANQAVNVMESSSVSYNSYNVFSDDLELALSDIVFPTMISWKEYFGQ